MPDSPPRRTYTQQEVTEILKRAMKQQSLKEQDLSHDELLEMADEVGIDRAALESATVDLAESRADELAREEDARELAQERSRLLEGFAFSLLVYLGVGAMLYFVDTRFTGGTWYYWVLMGWGIGLLFRLRSVFFPRHSLERRKKREAKMARRLERRALREARHRQLREAFGVHGGGQSDPREAEARARQVEAGAREFENAVQAGVAALLTVAARKITEHAARVDRADPQKRRR